MTDKALIANWVTALRSGQYKQGTGHLLDDDCYCCLGVLCKVAGAEFKDFNTTIEDWNGHEMPISYTNRPVLNGENLAEGDEELLNEEFLARIGIDLDMQSTLTTMNDGGYINWGEPEIPSHDFDQMADFIEKNILLK